MISLMFPCRLGMGVRGVREEQQGRATINANNFRPYAVFRRCNQRGISRIKMLRFEL
jgi:hypothetical protein